MLNSGVSIFTLNPLPKVPERSPLAAVTGVRRARGGVTATSAGATPTEEVVLDDDEEMALWTAVLI